jgi:ketosteroid isomerase-like protein
MKYRFAIAVVVALAVCAGAQTKKGAAKAGGSAEDALRAADHAYLQAFDSRDPNKCLALFAPGGQMMAEGMPNATTPDQIKQVFAAFFGMKDLKMSWKPTAAVASGNLGFTSGTFELSYDDNGKPAKESGKYVTIWQKQGDGSWKVIRDIENGDGPAK